MNESAVRRERGPFGRYLAHPLVLILLVASAASAVFGQVTSAIVVALKLTLSVALNFTQAYRSQRAALALRVRVAQTASIAATVPEGSGNVVT